MHRLGWVHLGLWTGNELRGNEARTHWIGALATSAAHVENAQQIRSLFRKYLENIEFPLIFDIHKELILFRKQVNSNGGYTEPRNRRHWRIWHAFC